MKKEKREKGKAHVRSNFKNTSNHQNIHVPLNSEEYLGMNKKFLESYTAVMTRLSI